MHQLRLPRPALAALVVLVTTGLGLGAVRLYTPGAAAPVPTTLNDFEQPGTQPNGLTTPVLPALACSSCHAYYDEATEPYTRWSASMMAQSARDPIFHAALAIAEQDAPASGDLCLRCHAPNAWLDGRSTPTDGSALTGSDWEGVNCNLCHRLVDPVNDASSPNEDLSVFAELANQGAAVPANPHSGQYVVDHLDRRRGPFDLGPSFSWHVALESPFHRESLLCATCHDVSNPAFTRVGGATPSASDTYALNASDAPHPTHDKYDEFPLERTFSEWEQSAFAQGGVDMGGLFGGNDPIVSSCQDCHMPKTDGVACAPGFGGEFRTDLPQHDFNGANSWVLNAILDLDQSLALYGQFEQSFLTQQAVDEAIARNVSMLQRAAELDLDREGEALRVRITNNSGHKLPTGYTDGRRMWINVRFLDAGGALVQEHGFYDGATADLTTADTKVYEAELGLDAAVAAATGLATGPSFHLAVSNVREKDNRIPPRGFTNAGFESVQAEPVGATYADGQYWDDTDYAIPCGAASAVVNVYHQTTSKEYITFLRDENVTNTAGQLAYDLWVANGMSAPVLMQTDAIDLTPRLTGDGTTSISAASGGSQVLCLDAGPANAGKLYWVLGSFSGTSPGIAIGGHVLPLALDFYTLFLLQGANQPPFTGNLGVLDPAGRATTTFTLPAGLNVTTPLSAWHAYAVFEPTGNVVATSNAVEVLLTP